MFDKIADKLKMGKHYKIERFGILMLAFVLFLGIDVSTIGYGYYQSHRKQLSDQVMYTYRAVGTGTGSTINVEGVYCSDDRTKCFVWMAVEPAADSLFSWDVKDYTLELYGSDANASLGPCESNPSANMYVFGAARHFGVLMIDMNGFPNQIVDLVLRNSGTAVSIDGTQDVFEVYCNPGGAAYQTLECLNGSIDDITPYNLYYDIVCRSQENQIKYDLDSQLIKLYNKLYEIQTYTRRVIGYGITVPEQPVSIRDDFYIIVYKDDDNQTSYMLKSDVFRFSDDDVLYYTPQTLVKGGFDFNWRDSSVRNGYLSDLTNGLDGRDYIDMLKNADGPEFSTDDLRWFRTKDGVEIMLTNQSESGTNEFEWADIQSLIKSWQDFYDLKQTYQCELLPQLLELELTCEAGSLNCSVNASAGLMTVYHG